MFESLLRYHKKCSFLFLLIASLSFFSSSEIVFAQKKEEQKKNKSYGVLKDEVVLRLLRTTMVAIDHANRVGNYAVLSGLGTAQFRLKHTPANLAVAFYNIRRRNIDFSPLIFSNPVLHADPTVNAQGAVRLRGHFPTKPLQVVFDLSYQSVNGQWSISDIAVGVKDINKKTSGKKNKSSKKK